MGFDQLIMEITNNPDDPGQWHEWQNAYSDFRKRFEAGITNKINRTWENNPTMKDCVLRYLDEYVINALEATPGSVLGHPVNGVENFINRGIWFGFRRAKGRAQTRCQHEGDMPAWVYGNWNEKDE